MTYKPLNSSYADASVEMLAYDSIVERAKKQIVA